METNFYFKNIIFLYLRRLPNKDGWLSEDGCGIQFASLISASSRLLAAIVENFARVSGVILFIVENARAACSSAGFLYNRIFFIVILNYDCFICHGIFFRLYAFEYMDRIGMKKRKIKRNIENDKKKNAKIDKM